MANVVVEDTIEAYLRANWTRTTIRTENGKQEPPDDGSSFLTLQFPASDTRRWPLGQRVYREEGGFRLVLATPRGEGMRDIRDWNEELSALFCDRKIGRVQCRTPSAAYIDGDYDEGAYILSAIVVPFEFNFTR